MAVDKSKTLTCSICGKVSKNLHGNTMLYPGWWICMECFGEAEQLSAKEDRWPAKKDFEYLKQRRSLAQIK
jgi:hypothetical protein